MTPRSPRPTISHADLVAIGAGWVKRARSRGGPGSDIVLTEPGAGFGQESPDVIGWKLTGPDGGSVLIEAKASRSDFLADIKKVHREGDGLGNWRYYLCPDDLIQPEECPAGWGLLYAGPRRRVRVVAGAHLDTHYSRRTEALRQWRINADLEAERYLLVAWLRRVESPEATNRLIRLARHDAAVCARVYEKERKTCQRVSDRFLRLQLAIEQAEAAIPGVRDCINDILARYERGDQP